MAANSQRAKPGESLLADESCDPREWGHEDYGALFKAMWPAQPTFHGYAWNRDSDEGNLRRDYTRCGLVASEYNRDMGRLREPMTWVPMRHAVKFGKPCRKCFQGGDD